MTDSSKQDMGLRDRDYVQSNYSRGKKRRPRRTNGRSIVVTLISINFALWLANGLFFPDSNDLTNALLLYQNLTGPLIGQKHFWDLMSCYQFLTYGFVHSYRDWSHIVFNMIGLLMFGYGMMLGIGPSGFGFVRGENVENRLGKREFLAFYLLTIIIGGVSFAFVNHDAKIAAVLGASGGVCGVVILYAWLFPKKTLLFWGILPMPMWGIGLLIVLMDAWGAAGHIGGNIAYSVHLTGAAFGTLYYFLFLQRGVRLTGWLDSSPPSEHKPKLRIHTPEDSLSEDDFNRRLDEILKRYGEVGESGLTSEEREFLQRASRKFAEKNRKR